MAKEGVTLDTVTIKIESDASKSTAGLDKLAASLTNLKSAISGGFANINKLANGLANLKASSEGLSDVAKNLEPLSKIGEALKPLSDIKATGFNKIINSLDKIPVAMNNITPNAIENVARVSNELGAALSPLASKLESIGQGYSAISKLADKYGVSVTKVRDKSQSTVSVMTRLKNALSKLSTPFRKLKDSSSDFGKVASRHFDKVTSKIKQIGLSLLGTRTIFTATRKAVSEYMSMDIQLADSLSNVWRALGAQLAPAVEQVIYLFKQFVRVIYSVIKAITGIDLIARANEKAMSGWGKSAKDLLGSLQKFDDLNVVDFNKRGSGDENKLIDLKEIDLTPIQKILDLVRKIKEEIQNAFKTKQWVGVGNAIADLFNYALLKLKVVNIRKAVTKYTKPFTEAVNAFFQNLNWSDLGSSISNIYTSILLSISDFIKQLDFKSLTQGIVTALLNVDFPKVLQTWSTFFKTIGNTINDITLSINLNWDDIKTEMNSIGRELANMFSDAIFSIDWVALTTTVIESINTLISGVFEFLSNFDWSKLGETLADVINTTFNTFDFDKLADSITELLHGLLTSLSKFVENVNWYEVGEKIVKLILDIDWAKLAVDLLQFCEDLWEGMLEAAAGVGASLGEWLKTLFKGKDEQDSRNFGERLGEALEVGMAASMAKTDPISRAIEFLKTTIKVLFGIHSPSKWARDEIGENISKGMANGLSSLWSNCKQYFVSFVNGVIELINSMIRRINNKLKISVGSTLASILQGLGVNVRGGYYQLFSIPELPKLQTGTNKIPEDGPYYLHKNEAVVPKKYNPAVGGGNNEELLSRVDRLIFLVENQEQTTVVNVGNETLYKAQKSYNKMQNNKYGTINV